MVYEAATCSRKAPTSMGRRPNPILLGVTPRMAVGNMVSVCVPLDGLSFQPWGWTVWLIYPLHMLQKIIRSSGSLGDRALLAMFQVLVHFPQSWGQMKFMRDRLLGRQTRLIEYK